MPKRILRLGPQVYGPAGKIPVGKTKFREDYINTGRLKLVPLGARAVGVVEDEIDVVVDELIAARDTAPPRPPTFTQQQVLKRRPGDRSRTP
jgi:hypothetical protein